MKKFPLTAAASLSPQRFLRRLVLAVLFINLLVGGLVALWLNESSKDYDQRARINTQNLALVLEQNIGSTFAKFDLLLAMVANEVEEQLVKGPLDPHSIDPFLATSRALLPEADGLRIADRDGRILYGTGVPNHAPRSIADRTYFRELQATNGPTTVISQPVTGLISGKQVLILARRLERPNKNFAGVVFASLDLNAFQKMFATLDIGPQGVLTLRDLQYGVVVRYPDRSNNGSAVGRTEVAQPLAALIGSGQNAGTTKLVSALDGLERMASFRRLNAYPRYITQASMATADYMEEWQLEVKKALALTSAFVLATLLAAWLIYANWQRKAAAVEALCQQEEKFRSVFYDAPVGHALNRMSDGHFVEANAAFCKITGYTIDEINQLSYWQLTPEEYAGEEAQQLVSLNASGRYGPYEKEYIHKDGHRVPVRLNGSKLTRSDGSTFIFSAVEDITEKKRTEELIWQQANFDSLTGLPNRRMFQDRLEQEIKKAHRAGLALGLLFLDLERFKEVNDTLGHAMGDILLKEAAKRLSACVRDCDTVARLGGDEFTIIVGELHDFDCIERIAENILHTLADPFTLGGEQAYVSASIGITLYPNDAKTIDGLLKNADQAMYAAKQQGRNRFHYFTASMQESADNRMRLASDLRGALAANQFRVVYQPIIELATGSIHKAEALIRWQHPSRGLISPANFIPIAEDTGLIGDIGDWVFGQATRQVASWRRSLHPAFQISVNVSPVQFYSEGHSYALWFELLREMGLPGDSIAVEITEGLLLDGNNIVTKQLLEFRDAGMQVAIDDFGTGYSSLSYLKKFDIDYLKIDQSFVRNLAPESEDLVLCEAIIAMAHKLGLKVIAEGVESEEQKNLLLAVGCDYGQGYLFSRPVEAADFTAFLQTA